jgi:NTE family protein
MSPFIRFFGPVALCSALFAAGASFADPSPVAEEPWTRPAAAASARPRMALVLSGGAARGFAHVGVLKVLEENAIRPDLIVGSSSGALIGALYASGLDAHAVEKAISEMDLSLFNDVAIPGLGYFAGLGFVRGEKLRGFVARHVRHARIQDFPMGFAAVATDLQSGAVKPFNAGDAARAVQASSAVPALMVPVAIGGRYYGDGQITSPVPIQAARRLGARVVIAVDVLYPPRDARLTSALGVLFQTYAISARRLADHELAEADIVIAPDIPPTSGQFAFESRQMLIATGDKAAREALPAIRQALASARAAGDGP